MTTKFTTNYTCIYVHNNELVCVYLCVRVITCMQYVHARALLCIPPDSVGFKGSREVNTHVSIISGRRALIGLSMKFQNDKKNNCSHQLNEYIWNAVFGIRVNVKNCTFTLEHETYYTAHYTPSDILWVIDSGDSNHTSCGYDWFKSCTLYTVKFRDNVLHDELLPKQ